MALAQAPLVRVLVVVRFPEIAAIARDEFVAPFQEALRSTYPVGGKEETVGLSVGPQGVQPLPATIDWRLSDLEGAWRVSLGRNFVALETTRYTTREDFLSRFQTVLDALTVHVQPGRCDRVGVRYIDQIQGEPLARLRDLVQPSLLGLLATDVVDEVRVGLSDYTLTTEGQRSVRVRTAKLPAGATLDPLAAPPIEVPSWVLDIDASRSERDPWDETAVMDEAAALAELAHRMFRWAVTRDFITTFGGPS